jgi:hypothetical protein
MLNYGTIRMLIKNKDIDKSNMESKWWLLFWDQLSVLE